MKQKSLLEAWRFNLKKYKVYEYDLPPENNLVKMTQCASKFDEFADFIEEKLTLADFVPCKMVIEGTIGNIDYHKYIPLEKPSTEYGHKFERAREEYQQALDRVVYEGFIHEEYSDCIALHSQKGVTIVFYENGGIYIYDKQIKTSEDMEGFEMKEQWYKKYFN